MTGLILKVFPIMLLVVVVLDLFWLGFAMKDFYRAQLGHLMAGNIVWGAAIIFYFIYAAGILYFAVMPALATGSLVRALVLGTALGLFAYATYDLTNQATLRDWPVAVTIVDILWGGFLSGAVASLGFILARMFGTGI